MRLARQAGESWQYLMSSHEAHMLAAMLKDFPLTVLGPAQFSKTEDHPLAAEREKLLVESLAEHRNELKGLAVNLLAKAKWKTMENGQLLSLTTEAREVLLQILNDIRIGCWEALGQPESLEEPVTNNRELAYQTLMNWAGYFEMNLLESEI